MLQKKCSVKTACYKDLLGDKDQDKHMVFITEKASDFPADDEPTTETTGDNNVIVFAEIGVEDRTGTAYE